MGDVTRGGRRKFWDESKEPHALPADMERWGQLACRWLCLVSRVLPSRALARPPASSERSGTPPPSHR